MEKLDIRAKTWEKNPALVRIMQMLEDAFNSVGEKIRGDLLRAYRKGARDSFTSVVSRLKRGDLSGEIDLGRGRFSPYKNWREYTRLDAKAAGVEYKHFRTWDELRPFVGFMSLDLTQADRAANDSYEHARDSFVHKNLGKLATVIGQRSDLKNAVVRFDWRGGAFRGNMQIYLEGAYFRGDVDVKYVIRTIPNVTPYFQYPLVFVEAEVAGKHYNRPSEAELRILLGATKSVAEEKREAAAAAGLCPMSGQEVPEALLKGLYNRMSVYVTCPSCRSVVSVNKQSWKFRNHKTPGAQRAGEAQKLETAGYCPASRQKMPAHLVEKIGPVEGYKDPKGLCESCGQQVRLDAEKEWIRDQFLTPDTGYPTKMKVLSAKYYKHRLTK